MSAHGSIRGGRAVDYEGTDVGCLIGIAVGALIVSAIPFGGVVTMVLGYVWALGGKNERIEALRFRLDGPSTAIRDADVGESVTLVGTVTGSADIETPLGHRAVVANLWLDGELSDDVEDPRPTWTKLLGDRLELEAEGGRIVMQGVPLTILSEKKKTTDQIDGEPPPHAPLTPEERQALTQGCEQYGERWLEPGMEVLVTGVVGEVDDIAPDHGSGYRSGGLLRQVTLRPLPDEGVVRVSSYSPRRVAELARQAKAAITGGVLMGLIGLFSLVYWIRFFTG